MAKAAKRPYIIGTCQDCGRTRRVTRINFWVNGYKMNVCADCIKPYRSVITTASTTAGYHKV